MTALGYPAAFGQYPTRSERIADLWVHIVGVGLAILGGGALIIAACLLNEPGRAISISTYVLCLLMMLSLSAASNLADVVHQHRRLQNADEAAIFLMIAGSYTPFTTQILHGQLAIGMTLAIWGLALAAAGSKLFLPRMPGWFSMFAYIALGWLVVLAAGPLIADLAPASLFLLVAGGVVYTLGTISYAAPRLRYRRAIWHGFVLAAAMLHFAAILTGVVLA
jgi:hemolysin III